MMKKLQWAVVLALVTLSATAGAQTYSYLGHRMLNNPGDPFRYYVDSRDPNPAQIELSSVISATRAAFDTWENVACAYSDFEYMGTTSSNTSINPNNVGNPFDTFNVSTVWVNSTTDPYYELALGNGLSITGSIPLTYGGYLYQCDIYVNSERYRWTTLPNTNPSAGFYDLQSALTHEIGHCLGLEDVYSPSEATMNPELPLGNNRRQLSTYDQDALCNAYPQDGAVGSPCSASDECSNGLSCIPRAAPDGGVLYSYCTKSCPGVSPGECPEPFVCRPNPTGAGNVCVAAPGEAITQVGKPCGDNTQCGSARAICRPPEGMPSGQIAWAEGYCQEECTLAPNDSCPAGSTCSATDQGNRCLKSCRVNGGDCRTGYTCTPLSTGPVCVPNCYINADCNDDVNPTAFICRTCDRICVARTSSVLSVGDPCTRTDQCGEGQVCLFLNNQATGVCAQPCANGACVCPGGTSCQLVGNQRVCVRGCNANSCAQPLVCNPIGDAFGCLPGCQNHSQCPTGLFCGGGICYDPYAPTDAGCTLCGTDSGTLPTLPTDAGNGNSDPPQGCGCSGGPASALVLLAALALLLRAGGRRAWERR